MVNNKINLSVIIPAYNAERYIPECLDSIIKNGCDDIEVLVIDDGSTDNSKDVIKEYVRKDNRIQYIYQNNSGVSAARNMGLDNAKGRYIMFLDADDFVDNKVFDELLENILEEMPDFTAYSKKILYPNGRIKDIFFDIKEDRCSDKRFIYELMYASSSFNECWGKIYKKEIIDKYGLRFPAGIKIGEDLLFVYSYFEKCNSFELVNSCLLMYRQHEESAMRKSLTDDRLKITDMLYNCGQDYLNKINDLELSYKADIYYFRVLTNLCREFASSNSRNESIRRIYTSEVSNKIMKKLKLKMIPTYKMHEYLLMKYKMVSLSAFYYGLKARA